MDAPDPAELPDLFRFNDGRRVRTRDGWPRRRAELLDQLLGIEYGRLPPAPARTEGEPLHRHTVARFLKARHQQFRILTGPDPAFAFLIDLLIPDGDGPFPVMLTGDGCWKTFSDEITLAVLGRGYAIAQFNRVEVDPDVGPPQTPGGLHRVYPGEYGSLSAWAWGYHRCVDFLLTQDWARADQIVAVGASRGGKAALLAGATDERIALTAPNDSGCSGAGCYRRQGPNSETLREMLDHAPHWLSPRMADFLGRERELPFDQHGLKALVAPRCLLTTEALGDLGANPTGTWLTHLAAREVYRFLGVPERIGIWYREGAHGHTLADWQALLQVADWQFRGVVPPGPFDRCPFPDLPAAHAWSAPVGG